MGAHGSGWLTVDEAARELRLSRSSIYRMVQGGALEAFRVGQAGTLRFRPDAVNAVLTPAQPDPKEQTR